MAQTFFCYGSGGRNLGKPLNTQLHRVFQLKLITQSNQVRWPFFFPRLPSLR